MSATHEPALSPGCHGSPAGVILTPDEWLIVWAELARNPSEENQTVRDKIHSYLEARKRVTS